MDCVWPSHLAETFKGAHVAEVMHHNLKTERERERREREREERGEGEGVCTRVEQGGCLWWAIVLLRG